MQDTAMEESGLSGKIIIGAIVAAVVVVVVLATLGQKHKFEPVQEGKAAPDFILPDLEGTMTKLSDYRGKVIFLNFWATWCKPCEEEMPSMQTMYSVLKKQYKDFELLAVSIDKAEPEKVESFARKYGAAFPILHDRKGKTKEVYKTTGVPETFIIDQNGIIAEKVLGPRNWSRQESVRTILDLLINGPSDPDSYQQRKVVH